MDGVHQLTDVIQVCTDGSPLSEKGVDTAVRLAKALGLPLVGMTSVAGKPNLIHGLEHEDAATRERLAYVEEAAKKEGVPVQLVAEHCASPSEGILAVAHRYDARFVVMASRGLGSLGSLLLGSETQKVLAQIDRPVLVIR
ncbi:MAG: universal stress protein [Duodenibacillus sp.]